MRGRRGAPATTDPPAVCVGLGCRLRRRLAMHRRKKSLQQLQLVIIQVLCEKKGKPPFGEKR